MSILVIEDDPKTGDYLKKGLRESGYAVDLARTGTDGLHMALEHAYDLVVLDVMLPGIDGWEIMRTLRARRDLPVIFLTSKDDEIDEVMGLRMGADDYIKKPFSQRLLLERISAVLRRHDLAGQEKSDADVLRRGDLVLDKSRHLCTWKDKEVNLTVTEFLLVEALARRPGHVKNRDQLIDAAYGEHIYVDDRTIDSHVKRLRRKFKDIDEDFAEIETLYGIGYRYRGT